MEKLRLCPGSHGKKADLYYLTHPTVLFDQGYSFQYIKDLLLKHVYQQYQ